MTNKFKKDLDIEVDKIIENLESVKMQGSNCSRIILEYLIKSEKILQNIYNKYLINK